MHVTVTKTQDGNTFLTKDAFGELYSGDVIVDNGPESLGTEATVALGTVEQYGEPVVVGTFSWVDYKDTSTVDPHAKGVRHTHEFSVPGVVVFGPYAVAVVDSTTTFTVE